jgi:hypothetical protein
MFMCRYTAEKCGEAVEKPLTADKEQLLEKR